MMIADGSCLLPSGTQSVTFAGEGSININAYNCRGLYVSKDGETVFYMLDSEHNAVVTGTDNEIVHVQIQPNENDLDSKSNGEIREITAAGKLRIVNVKYVFKDHSGKPTSIYDGSIDGVGDEHGYGVSYHVTESNEERVITMYDGMWKNGSRHGQGVVYRVSNQAFDTGYVGNFQNGRRVGFGMWLSSDQKRFMGHWKNGKLHGRGLVSYPNGNVYVGEWHEGKRDGKFTHYSRDGHTTTSYWKNGVQTSSKKEDENEVVSRPKKRCKT